MTTQPTPQTTTVATGLPAVVVEPDGVARRTEIPRESGSTLNGLQDAVGGPIAVVRLLDDLDMVAHDEALLVGAAFNPVATAIAHGARDAYEPIFGPVVFTGGVDHTGEDLPLSEAMTEIITTIATAAVAAAATN